MFLQNVLLIPQMKSSFAVKGLGLMVDTRLNMSQQHAVSEKVIKISRTSVAEVLLAG